MFFLFVQALYSRGINTIKLMLAHSALRVLTQTTLSDHFAAAKTNTISFTSTFALPLVIPARACHLQSPSNQTGVRYSTCSPSSSSDSSFSLCPLERAPHKHLPRLQLCCSDVPVIPTPCAMPCPCTFPTDRLSAGEFPTLRAIPAAFTGTKVLLYVILLPY